MTIEAQSAMPALPEVGDLDWGPQINACMVWLYEQMANNAILIAEMQADHGAMGTMLASQADRITVLEDQVAAQATQIAALQVDPDYVYDAAPWTYHNGTPPALAQQIRVDTTDLTAATVMDIRLIDLDGADRSPWLKRLSDSSMVRISDWDDSSRYHLFRISGPATFTATNAQFPVVHVDGVGSIASNQKSDVGFFIDVRPLHPLI